jgi:hypothetical protein
MDGEPEWKELCLRLAVAISKTPCAGKNADIYALLSEIKDKAEKERLADGASS